MKTPLPLRIAYVVGCILSSLLSFTMQAQTPEPDKWETFVMNTTQNPLVIDTFLFQSFEESASDTWHYTSNEAAKRMDVSTYSDMKGQGGAYSFVLPKGASLAFTVSNGSPYYKDTTICATYGGVKLASGASLMVSFKKSNGDGTVEWCRSSQSNWTFPYRTVTTLPEKRGNPIQITQSAVSVRLYTPESNGGEGYCVDSVYAFGKIPRYSLFNKGGNGVWKDATLWTTHTPERHRGALIKGNVQVEADVQCDEVLLSDGAIHIKEKATLSVSHLQLYYGFGANPEQAPGTSLKGEGKLLVSDRVSIHKTFAQKGKWYLISFPFDVYGSGIDPAFTQKDGLPNQGGNFFYVCTYDGQGRASTNSKKNWKVVDPVAPTALLFQKNRGYLIALDEKAGVQTIQFTSSGAVATDFGRPQSVAVVAPTAGGKEEDNGWYLCGNPLFSPLPLKSIQSNPALDGYVYIYEGGDYKAYSLKSNWALPPLSSFFVKAKQSTTLEVEPSSAVTYRLLPTSSPLLSVGDNPQSTPSPTHTETELPLPAVKANIQGDYLHVKQLPHAGTVRVVNLFGYVLLQERVEAGDSTLPLTLPCGIYLVQLEGSGYRHCLKVVKV